MKKLLCIMFVLSYSLVICIPSECAWYNSSPSVEDEQESYASALDSAEDDFFSGLQPAEDSEEVALFEREKPVYEEVAPVIVKEPVVKAPIVDKSTFSWGRNTTPTVAKTVGRTCPLCKKVYSDTAMRVCPRDGSELR